MSAFLGPIHTWLYGKITLQNELTNQIVARIEKDTEIQNIASFLDRRYGQLENGELAEIIDEGNIHGWLQERVSLVENRLAAAVSTGIEQNPKCLTLILDEAYRFGKEHEADSNLKPKEIFQLLDSLLLNGMPCDHVNRIISESDDLVAWEQTVDIHRAYWDMVKGDVTNYYNIKNAVIDGIISKTGVCYTETESFQYELRVKER